MNASSIKMNGISSGPSEAVHSLEYRKMMVGILLPPGGFIALAIWLLTFATVRERKAKRTLAAAKAQSETTEPVAVHA